jgi:hypothetical protein
MRVPRSIATQIAAVFAVCLLAASPAIAKQEAVIEKFENGQTRLRYSVDEQKRKQGTYKEYHPNGQIKVGAVFKDDLLEGKYLKQDDAGKAEMAAEYRAGKLHGWCRQYEGGKLVTEQAYLDGMLLYPKSQAMIQHTLAVINATKIEGANFSEVAQAVRRAMQYRYLCDVPWEGLTVDAKMTAEASAAARACEMLGRLEHQPPNPGMSDADYHLAKYGASHSNLSMGPGIARSVDGYMDDSDPSNIDRVGHRRWVLFPPMLKTAFGGSGRFSAMRVMDKSRTEIPDYDYVAYPPRGLLPAEYFGNGRAWHISLNPRKYARPDEKKVKVSVHPVGGRIATLKDLSQAPALKLNYDNISNSSFGTSGCIIFRPDNVDLSAGSRYWVSITGVQTRDGKDAAVEYLVEFTR